MIPRKVMNVSILEVCDLMPRNDIALISIREPGSGPNLSITKTFMGKELKLQSGWENLCILEFDDIDEPCEYMTWFKDHHADKIIEFVESMKDKHIIVHCHAGISRSGAVALFISEKHGHVSTRDTSCYNKFVYGILEQRHEYSCKE